MIDFPGSASRGCSRACSRTCWRVRGAVAAMFAVLLALSGCGGAVEPPPLYHAATAEIRDLNIAVEAAGVIEPITTVEVKSKASGEVLALSVETGQVVAANTLMVRIDQRTPRNNVAQAEAALVVAHARLDNSRAQLARTEQLFKTKAVSEVDYERATLEVANGKAEVVRSEVQLQNARIAMEDTDVRAPIAGTIIDRLVERGQVISSPIADFGGGSLLLKMADLSHVQVRAQVDETDIGKIGPGIAANVSVTAFPNRIFAGKLRKIEPQATNVQNVTMFPVLIDLDNHDGLLKPGMNATVNVDVASRKGALVLPNAALRTDVDAADAAQLLGLPRESVALLLAAKLLAAPGSGANSATASPARSKLAQAAGNYIVFIKKEKTYQARRVRTGVTDLDYTEIIAGIKEGEQAMVLPSASLARAQQEFKDRVGKMMRLPSGSSKSGAAPAGSRRKPAPAGG